MGCGAVSSAAVEPAPNEAGHIEDNSIDNLRKITDFYDIDEKRLGSKGALSLTLDSVRTCTNRHTGLARAVKTVSKSEVQNVDLPKLELAIMQMVDHPNIIKFFEYFEDQKSMHFVTELCTGGDLFIRISESGRLVESQGACVSQQMFQAIFYLHEHHICHRDLRPEKFLFASKDIIERTLLKLIDFGSACKFESDQVLTTKVGSPYYASPQVLAGKYDQSADMWSLGCITYVLLCGYPPFYGEFDKDVLAKVRLGTVCFNAEDWKTISEDAKNLVRMLLKMNPRERYTSEQALKHVWLERCQEGANILH